MPEPRGHTLLTELLRVANRAIEAHRDEAPWREIIARTSRRESPTFGVAIFEDEPEVPVERCAVRLHEGRFERVRDEAERPIDWRVSVPFLRDVAAHPDRYIRDPRELELAWVAERLGLGA